MKPRELEARLGQMLQALEVQLEVVLRTPVVERQVWVQQVQRVRSALVFWKSMS